MDNFVKYSTKEKDEILKKALLDGGFYGTNGVWNSLVTIPGIKGIYRKRVETLIIRNGKEVFMKLRPDKTYFLPGGSTERDVPDIDQAVNECREEARINVKNIESTAIFYIKKDNNKSKTWKNDLPIHWDGYLTYIYIADFDNYDHGEVRDVDKDPYIKSGKFYPIKECMSIFSKEHRAALSLYLKEKKNKDDTNMTESTLGHISTYIGNKFRLKRLEASPKFGEKFIGEIIAELTKTFNSYKRTKKFKKQLAIKNRPEQYSCVNALIMTNDVEKKSFQFYVSFYDVFSPAEAGFERVDESGYKLFNIVVSPKFFTLSDDIQRFTLLHEIGHCMLGHTEKKNELPEWITNAFYDGNVRNYMQTHGKVDWQELNADAYAILNGAKLYTVLGIYSPNDVSKVGRDSYADYHSNAEISRRYLNLYNKYRKHLYGESTNDIDTLTPYDLVNFTIKDYMENFSDATDDEKNNITRYLYNKMIKPYVESTSLIAKREEFNENTKSKSGYLFGIDDIYFESMDDFVYSRGVVNTIIEKHLNELLSKIESKVLLESGTGSFERYKYLIERATKRKNLPDEKFGIPELRKYPLDTKKHVYSAIKLFGHYADTKYADHLAHAILNAMDKYHISRDYIGEKNRLKSYIK